MWFSCLRVLLFQTGKRRLHFAVWASVCGTALAVAALLVVLTIASSFLNRLNFFLSHLNPHVVIVQPTGWVDPGWVAHGLQTDFASWDSKHAMGWQLLPFIYQEGFLTHSTTAYTETEGIYLRASAWQHDPVTPGIAVTPLNAWPALSVMAQDGIVPVVLGETLAHTQKAQVGDVLTVSVLLPSVSPQIASGLRQVFVRVVGIANVGLERYDATMVLVDLSLWQKALQVGKWANGVGVFLPDASLAPRVAQHITTQWNMWAVPWQTLEHGLVVHVQRDGIMVSVVVGVISLVACSNVVVTLILLFLDKQHSFSILRVLGVSAGKLGLLLLVAGWGLSLAGAILGVLMALGVLHVLSGLSLQDFAQFYYLKSIPVSLDMRIVLGVLCATVLVATLGSVYPAWRVAKRFADGT